MPRTLLVAVTAMTSMAASIAPTVLSATASPALGASTITNASVRSVSCASAGNCVTGGVFWDSSGGHAFVLTESNGQWGRAIEVPGLAALHPQSSDITSVSCAPAGGCTAGGWHQNATTRHAFVISERNGQWGRLTTVFSVRRKPGVNLGVSSLSCPAPGSCSAGGAGPPFVVREVNGRWGRAIQLPTGNKNGSAVVSCATAGNCLAGWGTTLVVRERNGHWGRPSAVPGLRALGTGAAITSLSCTSAVNCAVGGNYVGHLGTEVFVASERNGRWGKAIEIPGFTALNQQGFGDLASVSCISAGNCAAGGTYAAPAGFAGGVYEAFVASERNGRWGKAIEVPGIPPPSTGVCEPDGGPCVSGNVYAVSCAPGGHCAVGGQYSTTHTIGSVAFVASYENGRWGLVMQIPGLASLGPANGSQVNSVSCTSSGSCAAVGSYSVSQLFVVDENNGIWGQAQAVRF